MARIPLSIQEDLGINERDAIEAINRVTDWVGEEATFRRITIGITNPTWDVRVGNRHYFMKVPGKGTEKFIDRDTVHKANIMAAESGCGPSVAYWFPDTKVEIFDWLEGYVPCGWKHAFTEPVFYGMIDAIKRFP